MSKIANYETDAKEKLYDIAEKIADKYTDFMNDGRLMDTDIYEMIAPCLNYLDRLMGEYNALLGCNSNKLTFADLFGESLAEEFRHYREDCGIVADYEDAESFLPITERFPITSIDDEYPDAQWSKIDRFTLADILAFQKRRPKLRRDYDLGNMIYFPKNTGKGFMQKIAHSFTKLICPSHRGR